MMAADWPVCMLRRCPPSPTAAWSQETPEGCKCDKPGWLGLPRGCDPTIRETTSWQRASRPQVPWHAVCSVSTQYVSGSGAAEANFRLSLGGAFPVGGPGAVSVFPSDGENSCLLMNGLEAS